MIYDNIPFYTNTDFIYRKAIISVKQQEVFNMSFFLEDQMIEKAEMGDTLNMYMLGREYSGFGAYCKNPELEKAFFWLHKSADLGELSSMVLLG